MQQNQIQPAQVAGSFYPAEPEALNALIGGARSRARPDGGVAPKVVVAPHAGLVYSGSVAATAFAPWARRVDPPRRIVIIGPAHRVAFSGVAVHPASKWRTPLGEAPAAPDAHARLRSSARAGRRPATVRGQAFARNAPRDAAVDAAGAVRNRSHSGRRRRFPLRRGRPAPGLGRTGDGRRGLVRLVAFSRSKKRQVDRCRHGEAHRDAGCGGARWAPGLRRPRDQGRARDRRGVRHARKRPAFSRHRRMRAPTPRASSAMAPLRSNTPPPRGLPTADRERLLSACMTALSQATQARGKPSPFEPRRRPALVLALARDLRQLDRKRTPSRLHRFA